jgi:hypothetical protein
MARCNRCRTIRHEILYRFGGVAVCERCYDDVNPKLITYKLMHPSSVTNVEDKLTELKNKLVCMNECLKLTTNLLSKV